jgi:phospholipid/cholesterol/gamma-HCH transport system substrate-binding protein
VEPLMIEGMMTNFRVGLLLILGVGSWGAFDYYLGTADVAPGSEYILFAEFEDASGLSLASRVRIAGIDIGHIDKITLKGATARLKLRLRSGLTVHDDARVGKRAEGILGTNNIEISPGTTGKPLLPSGATIQHTDNSDAIKQVTETLAKTAKDIQDLSGEILELTRSVRQFVAGKNGEKPPLEKISDLVLTQVADLSGGVRELIAAVHGVVDENRSGLRRTMQRLDRVAAGLEALSTDGNRRSVETILADSAEITAGLRRVLGEVETIAGSKAEGKGLGLALRASVDSLATAAKEIERVATLASSGKGPIGRLVSDEALGGKIDEAISGVNRMVGTYDRLQTEVEMGGGYRLLGEGGGRAGLRLNLLTRPDKGYILALASDARVSPDVTSRSVDGTAGSSQEVTRTTDETMRVTALFWRRFGAFSLRGGLMDNRGGVGVDSYAMNDRIRLSIDAFDFDRTLANDRVVPRHRAVLDLRLLGPVYVTVGVDDPFLDDRDVFVGAGVRFLDNDLKSVMAVAPSLP